MRRFQPRAWPIRWRLTALNTGVLAATLTLLGGLSLLQLDDALVGITTDHLQDQARVALVSAQGPRPPFGGEFRRPPGQSFSLPRAGAFLVRRLGGPDTGVQVFDLGGTLVAGSEDDEEREDWPPPGPEQLAAALSGAERSAVFGQQTRRTLLLVLPLRSPDGSLVGALALTRSLELTDQLSARLRALLVAGTVGALLVAGGLGLRASRAALRPLDQVIQAAREIGAGRLDQRLRLARRDEIGELADAFDGMLDRLAELLAAQRRFVADAAHELRTPLTALGGMVEMLQLGADRGDPATVRRMLDTMNREIERLGRLVADLLTLSRLEADPPLPLAPVDLTELVEEVAEHTRLLARGQQIVSRVEAPLVVIASSDGLRQVLLNLADNALKFTPPAGRIEFSVTQQANSARVTVGDSGSGIPPDVLPRVTDRFVRGDASRARATGGAGLGLAIARAIIEAHGGSLTISSEPDHGTSVAIDLPLPEMSRVSANAQAQQTDHSGGQAKLKSATGSSGSVRSDLERSST